MELVLGVVDVAYSDAGASGAATTAEVAGILEDRYHVMRIFYEEHKEEVAEALTQAMADQISAMASEEPSHGNPFLDGEQQIEHLFRSFLDRNEVSGVLPITQQITAAQMGMSKRFKAGHTKGYKERPAFIDTGLYQRSFRAWVAD